MKVYIYTLLAASILIAGCGKKQDVESTVADVPEPTEPVVEETPSLPPAVETLLPESEAIPEAVAEGLEAIKDDGMTELDEVVDDFGPEIVGKTDAQLGLASGLDFSNFSWDRVADVEFADKELLAGWAGQQLKEWQGKLSGKAMESATGMLSGLSDAGWQGALKTVSEAILDLKNSSPETWEMARGALISAWQSFETEAREYLGE